MAKFGFNFPSPAALGPPFSVFVPFPQQRTEPGNCQPRIPANPPNQLSDLFSAFSYIEIMPLNDFQEEGHSLKFFRGL